MKKIVIASLLFFSGLLGFVFSLYVHKNNRQVAQQIETFHYPATFVKQLLNDPEAGKKIFKEFCSACHDKQPSIDVHAPHIDDTHAWETRSQVGIENLLQVTIRGIGAMPARGGCFECSDEQLRATIHYILSVNQLADQVMIKNLQNTYFPEKLALTQTIISLFENAKKDAYQLSIVLLASAYSGDEKLYHAILPDMQAALKKIRKKNSYKTWLLGRVLLAADSIGDAATVRTTLSALQILLHDEHTTTDAFSAWGWGYLAGLNKSVYADSKQAMLAIASIITEEYQQAKVGHKDQADLHNKLSSAVYVWIMDLQAAANAQDTKTYHDILQQIKSLTGQSSITNAISYSLKRTAASNDYPAWGLGITCLAAATIKDKALYQELTQLLAKEIQQAKAADAKSEVVLAQLNFELAKTR